MFHPVPMEAPVAAPCSGEAYPRHGLTGRSGDETWPVRSPAAPGLLSSGVDGSDRVPHFIVQRDSLARHRYPLWTLNVDASLCSPPSSTAPSTPVVDRDGHVRPRFRRWWWRVLPRCEWVFWILLDSQ